LNNREVLRSWDKTVPNLGQNIGSGSSPKRHGD